nr:lysosomal beta glucosidase-like [Ipomoea batatas]
MGDLVPPYTDYRMGMGRFAEGKMGFVVLLLLCFMSGVAGEEYMAYKDPKQPVEARVRDLMDRMTLEEKIGQMTQIENTVATSDVMKQYFIGSVLSGGGDAPCPKASAEDWVNMVNEIQKAALSTRLGIPMIYGIDAIHGHNNAYNATIFPHNIGLGVTRDAELVKRIGAATALEVRATGIPYVFAPCIAGFVISDWQGIDKITDPPHSNYSYSVQAAILAGIDMVIVPVNFTEFINALSSLVKKEVIPMSRIDDAVGRILKVKFMMGLFENPMADFSLANQLGSQEHRELAREAVRKSAVLLKNGKSENEALVPLPKKAAKILVAGSHAHNLGYQCGGWTMQWQGVPGNDLTTGMALFCIGIRVKLHTIMQLGH